MGSRASSNINVHTDSLGTLLESRQLPVHVGMWPEHLHVIKFPLCFWCWSMDCISSRRELGIMFTAVHLALGDNSAFPFLCDAFVLCSTTVWIKHTIDFLVTEFQIK